MELNHLRYFYHVAKEGGFTNAAKALRIAQPSISKMVKLLEDDLNTKLFERSGRQVRLTKAGADLYRSCEAIFFEVEAIKRAFEAEPSAPQGPLTIATVDAIASCVLPEALRAFLSAYSGIYPQVVSTTAAASLKLVKEGRADLAIVFHAPELPREIEVISRTPVSFRLVAAPSERRTKGTLDFFIGSREVDDDANKVYPALTKLRKMYPRAQIRLSSNSLLLHKDLVISGTGVSILPEFLVREDIKKKRLVDVLKHESFTFDLKILARRAKPLSVAASKFLADFQLH